MLIALLSIEPKRSNWPKTVRMRPGRAGLLQWIRNNESKFWQNEAFRDDLEVDLERAVRVALLAALSDDGS